MKAEFKNETASAIVTYLPFLRRYARALTGSQTRGDQYVRACLETLLAEPQRIDPQLDIRFQVFATFHDVWTVVQSTTTTPDEYPEDEGEDSGPGRLQKGLATLPPIERQALLLVSLEGFSIADTAAILGLDEPEVQTLLDRARQDMQQMTSAPVLIIEDEQLIAMDIARIVQEMGHSVCGTAAREAEAIALAEKTKPSLVLADIQLKDGDSGIMAVREILKHVEAPVIFITGFPERLLTGEAVEPTFVLTKPFKPDALKAAIAQALTTSRDASATTLQ